MGTSCISWQPAGLSGSSAVQSRDRMSVRQEGMSLCMDSHSWGTDQHSMCLYPFQAMLATTAPGLHQTETVFDQMLDRFSKTKLSNAFTAFWLKECGSLDAQLLKSQSHELGSPVYVMVGADVLPTLHCDRDDLHQDW